MQKTFLKFIVFELVERIVRFRLLLTESGERLHKTAPVLLEELKLEAVRLEEQLLSHKAALNKLFNETGASAAKPAPAELDPVVTAIYKRLAELSQLLLQLNAFHVEPETFLFLKDALPEELTQSAGEHSVFLGVEQSASPLALGNVLMDTLPILNKNNPLGWVGLTRAYTQHLLKSASSLESLRLDLLKDEKKKQNTTLTETQVDSLLQHALNLRLLGPAYYFQALSEAVFAQDEAFFHVTEPALFYGLNHQNYTHKSLVILHEACERSKLSSEVSALLPLSKEALANVFRVVEKLIPAKYAFQEKQFERAIQLQERLSQGILLSSTPMYPVSEVAENLNQNREKDDFSIYEPLSMMTEYPHSPREVVNAGWLYKLERSSVWLYAVLNEGRQEGFENVMALLDYQDHLLRKSIEVSEVHRVLLCHT